VFPSRQRSRAIALGVVAVAGGAGRGGSVSGGLGCELAEGVIGVGGYLVGAPEPVEVGGALTSVKSLVGVVGGGGRLSPALPAGAGVVTVV